MDDKEFQSETQLEEESKNIIEDGVNNEPKESGNDEVSFLQKVIKTIGNTLPFLHGRIHLEAESSINKGFEEDKEATKHMEPEIPVDK